MRKHSRPKFVTLAVAGLIVAGGSLVLTPSAAEAADSPTCEANHLCLYQDINWDGGSLSVFDATNVETNANALIKPYIGDLFNDQISSLYNNTNKKVCFYKDANFEGGEIGALEPGIAVWGFPTETNDIISSFRPC